MLTVFFFSLVFFLLLVGATHFRYCFFITSVVGVFPSRNNSLIYISIFPPPRGAAAQTDVAARVPPPPPPPPLPPPRPRHPVSSGLPQTLGTSRSPPLVIHAARTAHSICFCVALISGNCALPGMECSGMQGAAASHSPRR